MTVFGTIETLPKRAQEMPEQLVLAGLVPPGMTQGVDLGFTATAVKGGIWASALVTPLEPLPEDAAQEQIAGQCCGLEPLIEISGEGRSPFFAVSKGSISTVCESSSWPVKDAEGRLWRSAANRGGGNEAFALARRQKRSSRMLGRV